MSQAGEDVKVLGHWASPFVLRALIALNLKRIEHEYLEEVFGSNGKLAKSELLLKSNPVYKKIPVLIHNGKPVCESAIIIQYIDEAWAAMGQPILPSDPHDRAIARFWAVYIDEWMPKFFKMLRAEAEEEKAEALEQAIEGLLLLEGAFAECSKGKGFFGGETVGYVDIVLGCNLGWIEAAKELSGVKILEEGRTPGLLGWAKRFGANDAVKKAMPETSKFVELAKMAQARKNAQVAD